MKTFHPIQNPKVRQWVVTGVLLTTVGSGWLLATSAPKPDSTQTAPAPRTPSGIGALGTLEPLGRIHRVAPSASAQGATLGQLLIEEGSVVEAGQLLAHLDNHGQAQAETSAALAQLETAQARLALTLAGTDPRRIESLSAELEEARIQAEQEQRESARYNELARRQTVSASDREDRDNRFRRAQMTVRRLSATLEEARHVRPEDVAIARAQVAEAEAAVRTARARLALTSIHSPISGRILKIHARTGERLGDKGLADLGDTSRMAAVAEVYEADVPRIRLGAPATIRMKTTDLALRGVVREIGLVVGRKVALDNDPVSDTDARVVEVRIEMDGESSRQVAGLSNARVDIVIGGDSRP